MAVGGLPCEVVEVADMGITLSDGIRLSARVWMPKDALDTPVPAVLEYIPYRKRDGTLPRDELMHPFMAGHGYACVRVDLRGSGDSEGILTDEYTIQEMADACEVIEFLAGQPWCSGSVGMMGKSWGGFNALQTAFLQPPALKAVVAVCATVDRFSDDIHFKGGCLLGRNFGWASTMLSYSSRPADPVLRPDWREDWMARLQANPWLAPRWADLQERSDYWQHGSVCEDYSQMILPVMIWGGWADNYMNAVAALVENAAGPVKGVVGPWVHQYPHTATPGPQVGFLQMTLRWWNRWLKGDRNGAEDDPAMRVFVLHSAPPGADAAVRQGHWIASDWPADTRRMVLALGPEGLGKAGDFAATVNTPQHLGLSAGEFFPTGLSREMAGDQREDDALSVCFDGPVLNAPLELIGAADLHLRLSSDQPFGFVVARLCDVGPDGASTRIAHGMLNLCHRDSMEDPAPMVPGQVVQVRITLDQMAYRLAPGHRLRLALSNTYWPFVWPSPELAVLTVVAGDLALPVHEGEALGWEPPLPAMAPAWRHRVLRPASDQRRVEVGPTGRRRLVVEVEAGDCENLETGWISGESLLETWDILPDDPLSAHVSIRIEHRLGRGDWRVRTVVETGMTATVEDVRMTARLTAWEGAHVVFSQTYDEEIARRFI